MANKKIVNATPLEYNDIKFRSKLEVLVFKTLVEKGFTPEYEPTKFTIWSGFKPSVPFYIRKKGQSSLSLDMKKQIDITYTPDIVLETEKHIVFIEVKPQFCNDVFPYKRKLFRYYLEHYNGEKRPIYAQIGTRKETLELIDLLKKEENEESV